ncbi:MAG: GNAT family N-acetyltransferase [Anaerolineae bacterium]|nr:GNAT family N-acetyltransferase [Anaerolineae bacterium]
MEHKIITLRPPIKEWIRPLLSLYSYWDQKRQFGTWIEDLRYRLEGKGGRDIFHVAMDRANPVAALDVSTLRTDMRLGCVHRLFVHPDYRRQGLARDLLKHTFERFREDGGQFLMLNSGWDTSMYHLYQEFGFQEMRRDPWSDGVLMARAVSSRSLSNWMNAYFAPTDALKIVQITPGHWAPLMLLCNQDFTHLVHHYALNILGNWAVDGRLLGLFDALETGRGMAVGLQTSDGALVGFATLMPFLDPWPVGSYQQHIRLLDIWIHPNFIQHTAFLLREMLAWTHPLPESVHHLLAFVETSRQELCQAFEKGAWSQVARLEQRYQLADGKAVDVSIYRKDKPVMDSIDG